MLAAVIAIGAGSIYASLHHGTILYDPGVAVAFLALFLAAVICYRWFGLPTKGRVEVKTLTLPAEHPAAGPWQAPASPSSEAAGIATERQSGELSSSTTSNQRSSP
jgi:hypothetical protein